MTRKFLLVFPCALATLAGTGHSAIWLGGNSNYATAANWSPSGNPAAATAVEISSGTATYSGNLARAGTTTISGSGTLAITGTGRLVNGSGGAAAMSISGTGGLNQSGEYFIVSTNSTGSITQTGGTVNSTVSRGWFMSDAAGSTGTYTLSGGALNVSTSGSSTANTNYAVHIGKNSGNDLLRVNGGTATFTATATNTRTYISKGAEMRIDSGSATFNDFRYFIVGRDTEAGSTSQLTVNNGSLTVSGLPSDGAFVIGGRNDGLVTLNGGTIDISGAGMWIGDADASTPGITGAFVQNGGELTAASGIVLSRAAGSTGTYLMTGGLLTTSAITTGAGTNPLFDFQGGEIHLTGDHTDLLEESWFQVAEGTIAEYDSSAGVTRIHVIPEPGTAALALVSLCACFARRRRA